MYKSFYKEYKKKLQRQYPSTAEESLPAPPVSPFLIKITRDKIKEIKKTVKLLYHTAHTKNHAKYIHTKYGDFLNVPAPASSLLMSYDFHISPEGQLKLIEVNTNASGYLIADLVDQVQGLEPKKNSIFSLKSSFEKEWKLFSGQDSLPPEILIIDHKIKSQKMYLEFLMYRDLLNSWGRPCRLCEADSLADSLQKPVYMIYNRCTDFYFERFPHLKQAFLKQKCCISPHPREYLLLADKARLCEWSSEDFLNKLELSAEEKSQIQQSVPATRFIDSFSPDELWKKRKTLFFKPLRGYGGKSVYRGKNISRRVFDRMIKEPGVIQSAIPPSIFTDSAGQKWKYDIRAYAYQDQVQKIIARVYQGQLTQFQKPLSGFASLAAT